MDGEAVNWYGQKCMYGKPLLSGIYVNGAYGGILLLETLQEGGGMFGVAKGGMILLETLQAGGGIFGMAKEGVLDAVVVTRHWGRSDAVVFVSGVLRK